MIKTLRITVPFVAEDPRQHLPVLPVPPRAQRPSRALAWIALALTRLAPLQLLRCNMIRQLIACSDRAGVPAGGAAGRGGAGLLENPEAGALSNGLYSAEAALTYARQGLLVYMLPSYTLGDMLVLHGTIK